MIREIRGLAYLVWLTLYRQLFTRKSAIALVLVGMFALAVYAWSIRRVPEILADEGRGRAVQTIEDDPNDGDEARRQDERQKRRRSRTPEERVLIEFGEDIIMGIFVTFLAPLLTLIYATSVFGDERDDRTLVYLLTRPLGRWRLYIAKGLAILPVTLAVIVGSFVLVCLLAGEPGRKIMGLFLPGVAMAAVCYSALFLLFGAVAPRPLIMSVVYAFLIETLVGNMPGTLKRVAVSYHVRCLLFHAGTDVGLTPANPKHLVPISADAAMTVLWIATALLVAWGAFAFQRREYRDLA